MPVAGHPGCDECRLRCAESTWTVPHDFNYDAKVLFVLDQFHPGAIKKARKLLANSDFVDLDNAEFAFTTRCWDTEDNKAQVREGQKCYPLLGGVLEKVSKDTLVVPMGATPCKLVAGAKTIQTAHGTVMKDSWDHVTIPTLHPAQVVAYPESLPTFLSDLEVINDARNGVFTKALSTDYTLVNDVTKFKQMIAELWMSKAFAFDTENTSLDPFKSWVLFKNTRVPTTAKVLGMSFSNKAQTAWFLPLDHPGHVWNVKERAYIVKMVKALLEADHNLKIAHNGKYDIKYLRKVLDIHVIQFNFDTLLAHYVAVSEEKGTHGLKILAWEFTDMGGYDDPLDEYKAAHPEADPDQGGNYGNIPLDILWPYGAADSDCTFRLWEAFAPKIAEKFSALFYNIVMPSLRALANIEYEGFPVDRVWLRHCQEVYPKLLGIELARLREFPEVIAVERTLTDKALKKKRAERVKRFKVRSQKILEMQSTNPDKAATSLRRLQGDIARAKVTPVVVKPITFNPGSPDQKVILIYDMLGMTHTKKTKTKGRCADKEVLKDLWFDHKHPILMALGRFMKMATMYTMFVRDMDDIMGDDGRVRGSYNPAGTETGRLSCSAPNLQQLPRNLQEDALEPFIDVSWPSIKRIFAAVDEEYCIMQFDYSQAELRVLAALSHDPVLVDAYNQGQDVHQRVAAEVYGITMEEVTKPQRYKAKRVNFGLLYGQGARKLAALIGCSVDEAKEFISLYFKRLKKVQKWISGTKAKIRETGESWSPYGRLRRLMSVFSPDDDIVARAERQGVNSPIQAAASDWTLMSIARIDTWLRKNNMLTRIVTTVHDSIILRVHMSEAARVYTMVKKIMQSPKHDGWLDGVPVVADADMGFSWGRLKGIKCVEDIPKIREELWEMEKAA